MKEEDAPESEDARECWCRGAPHHAAVSPPGKCGDCGWCRDHCRCFRRTAWMSLNTTRPLPSGCEILYSIRKTVTEEVGPVGWRGCKPRSPPRPGRARCVSSSAWIGSPALGS